MTTLETIYTVTEDTNDDGGLYYTVRDAEGNDVYDCDRRRDADIEASERNVNAAIEDLAGAIENRLTDLADSRSLSTLKALQAILATLEDCEE